MHSVDRAGPELHGTDQSALVEIVRAGKDHSMRVDKWLKRLCEKLSNWHFNNLVDYAENSESDPESRILLEELLSKEFPPRHKEIKFMECATCRAKPGTPLLCESCLNNRDAISKLQK